MHIWYTLSPPSSLPHTVSLNPSWISGVCPCVFLPLSASVSPVEAFAGGHQGLVEVGQRAGPLLHSLQVQSVAPLQILVGDGAQAVSRRRAAGGRKGGTGVVNGSLSHSSRCSLSTMSE